MPTIAPTIRVLVRSTSIHARAETLFSNFSIFTSTTISFRAQYSFGSPGRWIHAITLDTISRFGLKFFLHFSKARTALETVYRPPIRTLYISSSFKNWKVMCPSTEGISSRSPLGFHFLLKTRTRWSKSTGLSRSILINKNLHFSPALFNLSFEKTTVYVITSYSFWILSFETFSHLEYLVLAQQQ